MQINSFGIGVVVDYMKLKWKIVLLFFLYFGVAEAQEPFECKGQYYLSLTRSGAQSSGLYEVKIDPDGTSIYLDTISASIGLVINAMGYRITDNLIYGMDPNTAMLRKVGRDGVAVDLGIPAGIPLGILYYSGDVTPDGRYLILIGLSGRNPQIVKIDLESPNYQCSFVPIQANSVSILDVAFDPFTGILYGHDSSRKRLATIDPDTGIINFEFVHQPQVDQLGALFFDSFGNLFGYGAYNTTTQDKFVSVDKQTGEITLLGKGPISSGQDGCSCPYTIQLQKTVTPDTALDCTEVVYSFILSNLSGATRTDIFFEDHLPDVLTIKKILHNPYGGRVSLSKNTIRIDDMEVGVGIDTIQLLVSIDKGANGLYNNQAVLGGLPLSLGAITYSDNPYTFIEKDSTPLFVIPVDLSLIENDQIACHGDSVLVDIRNIQYNILWHDGDTMRIKWLHSPERYQLEVSNACGNELFDIQVYEYELDLNILEDTVVVEIGQFADFHSHTKADNSGLQYRWYYFTENPDVDCSDCPDSSVRPLFDGYYYLSVVDEEGCTSLDSVYVRVVWDGEIFAPNIISANRDGNNDVFYLSGNVLAAYGNYLVVYDRWGNKVYETSNFELNDAGSGWNGEFHGRPVVDGVYTWVAEIEYIDKSIRVVSGDVTVVR